MSLKKLLFLESLILWVGLDNRWLSVVGNLWLMLGLIIVIDLFHKKAQHQARIFCVGYIISLIGWSFVNWPSALCTVLFLGWLLVSGLDFLMVKAEYKV